MDEKEKIKLEKISAEMAKAGEVMAKNFLENFPSYLQSYQNFVTSYVNMSNHFFDKPDSMKKVQDSYMEYLQKQIELSKRIYERQQQNGTGYAPVISPADGDKRFKAPEWDESPYYFDYIKQNYLLLSQLVSEIVNSVELEKKAQDKLNFFTKQFLDALSPSNFFATNPEAIRLAQITNGQSVMDGFQNLLSDIQRGRISQSDTNAFEVGKNLAISKGSVIYENELIQLIQYEPTTENVMEYPLVIFPPWINKYYILDLMPGKSLVEFAVNQGYTVFMVSWRNPSKEMGYFSFDHYVKLGALKAIEVARKITGAKKVNTLGYCLGGTLQGITLSILRGKGKKFEEAEQLKDSVASSTFLAAMLDFSDIGPMGSMIDETLVAKLENDLKDGGVLNGKDMAGAFNALRANELVWNYVVNNYLKGKTPPPFAVLYWTDDNTNLPAEMYKYYLRNLIFENKLSKKNVLKVCDTSLDLGAIDTPSFIIGTVEDHISPCGTVF
ncbi:MAG TPA: alpha/beta fold hydrolase, partial [Bacteroidia bacterium]